MIKSHTRIHTHNTYDNYYSIDNKNNSNNEDNKNDNCTDGITHSDSIDSVPSSHYYITRDPVGTPTVPCLCHGSHVLRGSPSALLLIYQSIYK